MAAPALSTTHEPLPKSVCASRAADFGEAGIVNLSANSDSREQREILDALPALVFLERAGRIIFANSEARRMLGQTKGDWTPRPVEEVLWGLFSGTAEPQTLLTGTRRGSPFHATMPTANGSMQPVEGTYSLINPATREAVIVAHPGRRERAPKTRLMEDVLASIPEAVAIEHGNHILYCNPAFARLFGYSADDAEGESLRVLIVPEARLNEHSRMLRMVDELGHATVETVRMTRSGELVNVGMQISQLLVDGEAVGNVFTFREIGEREQTEAEPKHNRQRGLLTGTDSANRRE
jgi:PAS domain S-box-containing protein